MVMPPMGATITNGVNANATQSSEVFTNVANETPTMKR